MMNQTMRLAIHAYLNVDKVIYIVYLFQGRNKKITKDFEYFIARKVYND